MTSEWKRRANVPRMPTSIASMTTPGSTEDFDDGGLKDDDVHDMLPPTPGLSAHSAPREGGYSMVAVVRTSAPVSPVKHKVKPTAQRLKHQAPPLASPHKVKKEIKDDNFGLDHVNPDAAQSSTAGIPLFARSQWVAKGLPTFQHYLLASHTPFGEEFGKNHLFVQIVQECIDAAYPGNTYIAQENDAIFTKAISRITDRRSKIGRSGVSYMQSILGPMSPAQRIKYVKWGLNILGPLFYSTPIPEDCRVTDRSHPDFPKLSGFGETEAYKTVFHAAVGDVLEKSQGLWGRALVGAFVMSGASVCGHLLRLACAQYLPAPSCTSYVGKRTVHQARQDH
ncbi:hypothetical protein CYLTODRAFT_68505 [Cylindrobasidium torrendii FP15055 ss-10]|uniref:Uncharacterized protein n=1 Tax=Cylindrobasidium torrendii FP15055 ss-10 TaxID=1314674 RepID=A0A0D7B4Y7_9AGAR|nr:hypothetical protein CYLTODRAFT_68505 [Cylindrobasidium torrendii FP15055 ss-10]